MTLLVSSFLVGSNIKITSDKTKEKLMERRTNEKVVYVSVKKKR